MYEEVLVNNFLAIRNILKFIFKFIGRNLKFVVIYQSSGNYYEDK